MFELAGGQRGGGKLGECANWNISFPSGWIPHLLRLLLRPLLRLLLRRAKFAVRHQVDVWGRAIFGEKLKSAPSALLRCTRETYYWQTIGQLSFGATRTRMGLNQTKA